MPVHYYLGKIVVSRISGSKYVIIIDTHGQIADQNGCTTLSFTTKLFERPVFAVNGYYHLFFIFTVLLGYN